jgi:hypothetical protein
MTPKFKIGEYVRLADWFLNNAAIRTNVEYPIDTGIIYDVTTLFKVSYFVQWLHPDTHEMRILLVVDEENLIPV